MINLNKKTRNYRDGYEIIFTCLPKYDRGFTDIMSPCWCNTPTDQNVLPMSNHLRFDLQRTSTATFFKDPPSLSTFKGRLIFFQEFNPINVLYVVANDCVRI